MFFSIKLFDSGMIQKCFIDTIAIRTLATYMISIGLEDERVYFTSRLLVQSQKYDRSFGDQSVDY